MDHQAYVLCLIATCTVAVLFAVLHLIAAISQLIKKSSPAQAVLMLAGALGVLAAAIDCAMGGAFDWLLMLAGGAMVCAAAIWNGKRSGAFHLSHHIVRAVVVIILILSFISV